MEYIFYISKVIGALVVILGFIGGIITYLSKMIKILKKVDEIIDQQQNMYDKITYFEQTLLENKNMDDKAKDLILSIARRMLLNSFDSIIKRQSITVDEFTVLGKLFDSYIENGGNSVICDYWEKIKELPMVNDDNINRFKGGGK